MESKPMTRRSENPLIIGARSVVFHVVSAVVTLVFLLFLPFLLAPKRYSWTILGAFVYTQIWLLKVICGQRFEVKGVGDLPPGPVIFAVRHEALWETLILPYVLNDPIVFLKDDIMRYPVAGWIAKKFEYIGLDRSGAVDKAREAFATARMHANQGRSFMIFPSGTRDPKRRHNVETGVAVLYRAIGTPVVPVVLDSGSFWPYKSWLRKPGTITVRVLPTIDPGLKTSVFLDRLKGDIAQAA